MKELKTLHKKFVVVPIDKTSGNVAFVCQRHYTQFLITELGLNNVNNITVTYMNAVKRLSKTELDNTSFLKNKFNLEVNETNKKLLI